MRIGWAILAGLLVGGGLAWWQSPQRQPREPRRAPVDAAVNDAAATPAARRLLYRWRNQDGVLQVTDQPPRGLPFERLDATADRTISIRDDQDGEARPPR